VTAPEFLWQADGPARGDRGVCGDLAAARLAAEGCLRGGASSALVEAATRGLGVGSLDGDWCPTGAAWLAEPLPGGGVRWTPVTAA
jgi:hypothetical protein